MAAKLKVHIPVFIFIVLISCKTNQVSEPGTPKAGMFKVAILYPNGDNKTFDMEYYEKKHMPMVAGFLGKNLRFYEIDRGIGGRTPTDNIPFVAVGYFYIDNVDEYNKTVAQNRDTIVNDIRNYTNILPVVQISEIKQIVYNKLN